MKSDTANVPRQCGTDGAFIKAAGVRRQPFDRSDAIIPTSGQRVKGFTSHRTSAEYHADCIQDVRLAVEPRILQTTETLVVGRRQNSDDTWIQIETTSVGGREPGSARLSVRYPVQREQTQRIGVGAATDLSWGVTKADRFAYSRHVNLNLS